ncbi:MAG: hypothetical protein VXZ75_02150 [Candidatus Thermoplasmatota archaeon]|nr:hypothetical protein [Candidatus Thermoplasmatota archaeon]
MTNRSFPVSMALLFTPTIILLAIRMILPTVDSILDSDRNSMMILHGGAIFIGILLLLRGNRSKDHEYLRSSAINRLNKIYNQEDAGLWSRADEALAKLETRKTKKRKTGVPSKVSSINKESIELDIGKEEPADIRVGGLDIAFNGGSGDDEKNAQQISEGTVKRRGFSAWVDKRAEKIATRRAKRGKINTEVGTAVPGVCRVCGIPQIDSGINCAFCGASK